MTTQHPLEKQPADATGEDETPQSQFAAGDCVITRVGRERGIIAHRYYGPGGSLVHVVDHPIRNGSRRKCYLAAELEHCDAN